MDIDDKVLRASKVSEKVPRRGVRYCANQDARGCVAHPLKEVMGRSGIPALWIVDNP